MSDQGEVKVPYWWEWLDAVTCQFEFEAETIKIELRQLESIDFEINHYRHYVSSVKLSNEAKAAFLKIITRWEEMRLIWQRDAEKAERVLLNLAMEGYMSDSLHAETVRKALTKGATIGRRTDLLITTRLVDLNLNE